ncbi:MAG: LEA type 2 family protein [Treponema sp.]|nr:LEA type 2 family protein [Treponema sp.]
MREPALSIHSVEVAGISFTGVNLLCRVNVENPNPFDVPVPELEWELFVQDHSFAAGTVKSAGPVKARKTSVVEIPVNLSYEGLYNSAASLGNAGEAAYRIALGAKIPLPVFGDQVWRLEHSGALPLVRMPSLGFRGISVKNISLDRLEFELTWEIENNNAFALNLKGLDYVLMVNNSQWGAARMPGELVLEPGKKTAASLSLSISALNMVREITGLIARGADLVFACSGAARLGGGLPGLDDIEIPFNFNGTAKLRK